MLRVAFKVVQWHFLLAGRRAGLVKMHGVVTCGKQFIVLSTLFLSFLPCVIAGEQFWDNFLVFDTLAVMGTRKVQLRERAKVSNGPRVYSRRLRHRHRAVAFFAFP